MEQEKKVKILADVLNLINKCHYKESSLAEQVTNAKILHGLGALIVHEQSLLPKKEEKEEE